MGWEIEKRKSWRNQRLADGRCPDCEFGTVTAGASRCDTCLAKVRARSHAEQVRREAIGICRVLGCNQPRTSVVSGKKGSMCADHAERNRQRTRAASAKICRNCNGPKENPEGTRCNNCCYSAATKKFFKSLDHLESVTKLFQDQFGKCAISGKPITPQSGKLEYKVPPSQGGKLEVANVHWVAA